MSSRELERVEVIGRVASGALQLKHAAEMLELSYRQTKRLWRRYREKAREGLKHRHAGQLSGLAGATKAIVFTFVTLTDADWHTSGDVVLMSLLGGMGSVYGPIVGAFSITALEDQLSDKVGSFVTVIIGAIFIVCVLLFRRGIVGEVAALYRRVVGPR